MFNDIHQIVITKKIINEKLNVNNNKELIFKLINNK